jgi:uncharacterized membrane protein HdeD (DUF308 family)
VSRRALPWRVQIGLHFFFTLVLGAHAEGRLPNGDLGWWIMHVTNTLHFVLSLYSLFTPPPPRGGDNPGGLAGQR